MSREIILIVDDDGNQLEWMNSRLMNSGFHTLCARNGKDALALIRERNPSLVLLDVQMPVMDGFRVLRQIRKSSELSHISVILLSSLDRENLKIKGLNLGADDYMAKPVKETELVAKVNAALRRSRHRNSDNSMKGDLSDVGLSDLLQSMEHGSKTAVIRMDEIDGEIHVKDGALVHVRQGRFKGYPALVRIFLKESGAFTVKFKTLPDVLLSAPEPLLPALMRVAGDVDEICDAIKQIGTEQKRLNIQEKTAHDYPDIEKYRRRFPCYISDLVTLMDHDPETNLETITRAIKDGTLYFE